MEITKTHKIITSIVMLAVLLGFYITFDKKSKEDLGKTTDSTIGTTTTTTTSSGGEIKTGGTGGYTITEIPINEGSKIPQPIPNLTRSICPVNNTTNEMKCDGMTPEVQKVFEKKVSDLREKLSKDPTFVSGWLDLGIYQKMVGDYSGAIESWKYASRLSPTDYISLGNLGNLYAYYLKDNGQAETYYKQAIAKGPTQAYLYVQLAEVYRDIFKDNAKALALIDSGLTKIPNDPSLLEFKSTLTKN